MILTFCCCINDIKVTVCMISAWYQFLHVTQPEIMSIYNSKLVLLSDVVDELIQDFVLFLLLLFSVFSLFVAFLLLCIVFYFLPLAKIKMLIN